MYLNTRSIGKKQRGFISPGPSLFGKKSSGGGGDPYWANVVSLLHFEGANGSTTFTDQKGLAWSAFGSAKIESSPAKFGSAMQITTTGGIVVPDNTGFNVGAGDWTAEMFAYYAGPNSNGGRLFSANGDIYDFISIDFGTANNLGIYCSSSGASWDIVYNSNVANITPNTWTHIAVVRHGTSILAFVNGSMLSLASGIGAVVLYHSTGSRCLGGQSVGTPRYIVGSIDEWRFTKGIARYTASFTPPTVPFPDHG